MRIYNPFPVRVRGRGENGEHFECETVSDCLSSRGICLRIERPISVGVPLFVIIQLTISSSTNGDGRTFRYVAARGKAREVIRKPGNAYQIDVLFTSCRFVSGS